MPQFLSFGNNSPDVRKLQDHLNRSFPTKLARLREDGIFGPLTRERVKEFQAQHGLTVDGIVGPKTEETLIYTADKLSSAESNLLASEFSVRRLANRIV